MKRIVPLTMILILMSLSIAGCASSGGQPDVEAAYVTGTVNKRDRKALAPSATIEVRLVDSATPDEAISMQDIRLGGKQLPIPFDLQYDPGQINPDSTYEVQVRIVDSDGNTIYQPVETYNVITQDNPTSNIEVFVEVVE